MNKLFENPNSIYFDGGEVEYDDNAAPFSYYKTRVDNGKMYIGHRGDTHYDLMKRYDLRNKGYEGDDRGPYSGRLYFDEKVITFWHFPESNAKLRQILKDLKREDDTMPTRGLLPSDTYLDNWYVEVPKDKETLKKKTKLPTDTYPDWDNKEQEFIDIADYTGGHERSSDELKQDHMKSPLLKDTTFVKPGFGSKHPEATQRFKREMDKPFENKEEEHYPRLNENPNSIYDPIRNRNVDYEDNAMPFWYVPSGDEDEYIINVGGIGSTHGSRSRYAGRLFFDQKIITFWHFPETKTKLDDVLSDLEFRLNRTGQRDINFRRDDWKIEVPNAEIFQKMKIEDITHDWGEWDPKKGENTYIDIDDYNGEYERSEEELGQEHVVSPLLKKSKDVPSGVGSKHPKYQKLQQAKMKAPFESVEDITYPRLNESPDEITVDDHRYFFGHEASQAFPFAIKLSRKTSKIIGVDFGRMGRPHDWAGLSPSDSTRTMKYIYPGRIYFGPKVLTFWTYPTMDELKTIIRMMEEKIGVEILEAGWRIEVRKDAELGMRAYHTEDRSDDVSFMDIDEYLESDIESKDVPEIEHLEHMKSPLLKKSHTVPPGFGSNNPKYAEIQHAKWDAPYENKDEHMGHYPRLFEDI